MEKSNFTTPTAQTSTETYLPPSKPTITELTKARPITSITNIVAIAYCNTESTLVAPSSHNFIGDYNIGHCIMDTSCLTALLKISSSQELDAIFARFSREGREWNYAIGRSIGTAGSSPTLLIKPTNGSSLPVRIASDICSGTVIGEVKVLRFHLCGDDIRCILNDTRKLNRFYADFVAIIRSHETSTTPRLPVSLIGNRILQQSFGLYFPELVFYVSKKTTGNDCIDMMKVDADADYLHRCIRPHAADIEYIKIDRELYPQDFREMDFAGVEYDF